MPPPPETHHYLAAPVGALWSWDASGEAIVWSDGSTVALREEIVAVLDAQSLRAWPPFEAWALLLAACGGRVVASDALLRGRFANRAEDLLARLAEGTMQAVDDGCAALERIASLPESHRRGLPAKRLLVSLLSESCPLAKAEAAAAQSAVLRVLREPGAAFAASSKASDPMPALAALAQAFGRLSTAELVHRLRTGLDAPPQAASIPLTPAALTRELLRQLAADARSAGLARAVRDILAALRLPRRVARNQEVSTSGAADIANQGPLDRLLLSELAQDDEVLAARIALREALYVRREPPATPPAGAFAVLLDSGVRSWGLPRVFGTAVALALAAFDERRTAFGAWRATDASIAPVDLTTSVGLTEHLAALETTAHPGAALRAFFDGPAFQPAAGRPAATEAVIVLTPEAAADPEFLRALAAAPKAPPTLYLATVSRAGEFSLTLHPAAGRAPACAARIELDMLSADPIPQQPAQPLRDSFADLDLPAYFRVRPAPLLRGISAALTAVIDLRDGRKCGVTERRELHTWMPGKGFGAERHPGGAQRHAHGLPGGQVLLLREELDGRILLITTGRQAGRIPLVYCSLEDGTLERGGVPMQSAPDAVTESNDPSILFFHFHGWLDAVRPASGEVCETWLLHTALAARCGPRHFRVASPEPALVAAAWDGARLQFPRISDPDGCFAVFPRPPDGALWGITRSGRVGRLGGGDFQPIKDWTGKLALDFGSVSEDGRLVWLRGPAWSRAGVLVDFKGPSPRQWPQPPALRFGTADFSWARTGLVPNIGTRSRFSHIGITASFDLALQTRRGRYFVLLPRTAGPTWEFRASIDLAPGQDWRAFQPLALPRHFPDPLALAEFADHSLTGASGSKAWLDPRGLLHLKSAAGEFPEMTLSINDGAAAVWTSEGDLHGPMVITGGRAAGRDAHGILKLISEFILPIVR